MGVFENSIPQEINIITNQVADLRSQTSSSGDTGFNSTSGENSQLTKGVAFAFANSINLVNLNLIANRALFAVVNISGELLGNIILPNVLHLSFSNFAWGNVLVETNQNALINSEAQVGSSAGSNTLEGNREIASGNAISFANNFLLQTL